jgi:hypothetical protein
MGHVYALGAVKPWVKTAAQEVGDKFDVSTIYGVGARTGDSDHPGGYALDFMVYADRAKGDEIYAYGKANWDRLGIKYMDSGFRICGRRRAHLDCSVARH